MKSMHKLNILFLVFLTLSGPSIQASEVYVDANDLVVSNNTATVMFSNFGGVILKHDAASSGWPASVEGLFGQGITMIYTTSLGVDQLYANVLIGPNFSNFGSWDASTNPVYFTPNGGWYEGADAYMAIAIFDDSYFFETGIVNNYYGWMHLHVNSGGTLTLIDYAYETNPNKAITTGAVSPVPLPASLWLFLSALVLGGSIRKNIFKKTDR